VEKLKDINWNHLYCFYEVARSQSLKEGAQVLGAASSTVSEQIKKLEDKFDKKLFHRSSKGLVLTVDGIKLFERARLVFEEGSKLLENFSEQTVGGYPVQVGINSTLCFDLSEEFISQYWDLYTKYGTVNTQSFADHEILMHNLVRGTVDWGISTQKPRRKALLFSQIGEYEVEFVCSPSLFKKFKDSHDLLTHIPLGFNNWDKSLHQIIQKNLRKQKIYPKEKFTSDHPTYLQKLCKRSRCVTYMVRNPMAKIEGLKTFRLNEPIKIQLYAIWKKSDDGLISTLMLKELLQSPLDVPPLSYFDHKHQIQVSEIAKSSLK
tara:strand:+ start:37347 stop:38306 length:960 start_codon:yes stop_codon:yes gene_type:complete